MLCSACGGDAGQGFCKGTGSTQVGYQGCPCTVNGGAVPDSGQIAVCPEHTGSDTQACSSDTCGGSTRWNGICDSRTDIGEGRYQFCACCPAGELACADCGGDKGVRDAYVRTICETNTDLVHILKRMVVVLVKISILGLAMRTANATRLLG